MIALTELFISTAYAKSPVILPVAGDYNIAVSDINFIKYTLAGILISILGFIGKWIFERIFSKQDSTDVKLAEVLKIVHKIDANQSYLERVTVKKEDLLLIIRQEIQYHESE